MGVSRAAIRPPANETDGGNIMSLVERLDSLRMKHQKLEQAVHSEHARPLPDTLTLKRLKMEKLRVKEEMDRIARA